VPAVRSVERMYVCRYVRLYVVIVPVLSLASQLADDRLWASLQQARSELLYVCAGFVQSELRHFT